MIHPDLLEHRNFAYDDIPWLDETKQFCLYYAVQAEGNITPIYYNTENVSQSDLDGLDSWFDLLDRVERPHRHRRHRVWRVHRRRHPGWAVLGEEWFDGLFANEPTVMPYGSAR